MSVCKSIALLLLDAHSLETLCSTTPYARAPEVIPGALPPGVMLENALRALCEGRSALWHSYFLFIEAATGLGVGSAGFRGPPIAGRAEIGYGVASASTGRGIATAGVGAVIEIAFRSGILDAVFAETSTGNLPSQRVLEKLGFQRIGERDTQTNDDGVVLQWLLERPQYLRPGAT